MRGIRGTLSILTNYAKAPNCLQPNASTTRPIGKLQIHEKILVEKRLPMEVGNAKLWIMQPDCQVEAIDGDTMGVGERTGCTRTSQTPSMS